MRRRFSGVSSSWTWPSSTRVGGIPSPVITKDHPPRSDRMSSVILASRGLIISLKSFAARTNSGASSAGPKMSGRFVSGLSSGFAEKSTPSVERSRPSS